MVAHRYEFKVGDTLKMRRGNKAGAVGTVTEIFKYPSGRRGLVAHCGGYAEEFDMRGYFVEFDLLSKEPTP